VTRVPPQRVPTNRPAAAPARTSQPKKPRGAADKKAEAEKPVKLKAGGQSEADGGGEAQAASEQPGAGAEGAGAGKEREAQEGAKHESLWAPESHSEASEKKEAKEAEHAEKERKEEGKQGVKPGAPASKDGAKNQKGAGTQAAKRQQSDGFERTKAQAGGTAQTTGTQPALTAQAVGSKQPVNAVAQTRPALAPPPSNRPPDAFQLLHQAQEKGVYFKEDGMGSGEREDPELAAAVEEAIRLLFGVRGILRVGPGKNMENEPVVVVVATQGFGEAAMKVVPPSVHRFPTLLAIPFDLLPLKKER
jgi:hypothetical protein